MTGNIEDYEIEGFIGYQGLTPSSLCDFPGPVSQYAGPDGTPICRCIICGRCGHHTGNTTQGHYWKMCDVARRFHAQHKNPALSQLYCDECAPDFHSCCPGNCQLFNEDGTRKEQND